MRERKEKNVKINAYAWSKRKRRKNRREKTKQGRYPEKKIRLNDEGLNNTNVLLGEIQSRREAV